MMMDVYGGNLKMVMRFGDDGGEDSMRRWSRGM